MQGAVAGYLHKRAEKAPVGEETVKKQQAVLSRIAAFIDPNHWQLPDNRPIEPVIRNRRRLLLHLLETTPHDQLIEGLVKLDQPEHSWSSDGGQLGRKPLSILENWSDFGRVVRA